MNHHYSPLFPHNNHYHHNNIDYSHLYYYDEMTMSTTLLDQKPFMRPTNYTDDQLRALNISKAVFGGLSFSLTLLFVIYVLVRSLLTFPWSSLPLLNRLKPRRRRKKKQRQNISTMTTDRNDLTEKLTASTTIAHNNNNHHENTLSRVDSSNSSTGSTIQNEDSTATDVDQQQSNNKSFRERLSQDCFIFSRPITRIFFFLQLCNCISISQFIIEVMDWHEKSKFLCMYQAVLIQYFGLAKDVWSVSISVWMFWILVIRRGSRLKHLELCSHLASWTIPLILTIIPWAMGELGDEGTSFCWIRKTDRGDILRFATHFIPFWICITLTLVLCAVTMVFVIKQQYESFHLLGSTSRKVGQLRTSMKLYIKLFGFPVVFLVVSFTPTALRAVEAAKRYPPFWFLFLNSFFSLSQGFLNTSVFVLSEIIGHGCDTICGRNQRYMNDEDLADQTRWDVNTRTEHDDDVGSVNDDLYYGEYPNGGGGGHYEEYDDDDFGEEHFVPARHHHNYMAPYLSEPHQTDHYPTGGR